MLVQFYPEKLLRNVINSRFGFIHIPHLEKKAEGSESPFSAHTQRYAVRMLYMTRICGAVWHPRWIDL
jgi:hypothetical protein